MLSQMDQSKLSRPLGKPVQPVEPRGPSRHLPVDVDTRYKSSGPKNNLAGRNEDITEDTPNASAAR